MIKPLNIMVDNMFRLYREHVPPMIMVNGKRTTEWTYVRGKLDRVYLRTCAVHKLLKAYKITWSRAEELLHPEARSVLRIWKRNSMNNKDW
jgi:hypothetical protein